MYSNPIIFFFFFKEHTSASLNNNLQIGFEFRDLVVLSSLRFLTGLDAPFLSKMLGSRGRCQHVAMGLLRATVGEPRPDSWALGPAGGLPASGEKRCLLAPSLALSYTVPIHMPSVNQPQQRFLPMGKVSC